VGVFRWHPGTFAKPDTGGSLLGAACPLSVNSADRAGRDKSDRLSSWIYRIECEDGGCYHEDFDPFLCRVEPNGG
jgi:hypothetical protein